MRKRGLGFMLLGVTVLGLVLLSIWSCGPRAVEVEQKDETPPDPELTGPDFFADVTLASGLDFTYRNGEEVPHLAILESLGGGVALIDFDGDGLLDIFVTGGGYYDGPDKKQIKGHPCKLFKNLGNFKFQDVTAAVGLDRLAGGQTWFYSHAAAVADYDRDGWPDLLVTGWGLVALFHNVPDGNGGRRFEDVSAEAGLDKGITWATSAAWADLDGDGWPDIYVCQYVNWSWENHPTDYKYDGKTVDVAPPKKFSGLPHKVFRNDTKGAFVDVSAEAGLRPGGSDSSKGLGVLAVDLNLDGKPDLYVANDTVDNFLYMNRSTPGKIKFTEEGAISGVARDGQGAANGSMGLDAGDYGGNGLPAIWVTNYENEMHALYRNMSKSDRALFLFATERTGIAAIGQKYVGWGTGFLDIDNHGWEDLFIANGHAIRYPKGTTRSQKPVLLRNHEGKFKDVTLRGGPYFRTPHLSRGVALGDLNNDGKIDAVISQLNEPVTILRNVSPAGNNWVGIQLLGKEHADVVGARVVIEAAGRKQTRFAKGGGSYASNPDRRLVFGLAKTEKIDKISVFWPNGQMQEWRSLPLNRYHVITQGDIEPREFLPKK